MLTVRCKYFTPGSGIFPFLVSKLDEPLTGESLDFTDTRYRERTLTVLEAAAVGSTAADVHPVSVLCCALHLEVHTLSGPVNGC